MKMMYLLRHTKQNSFNKIFLKTLAILAFAIIFVLSISSAKSLLIETLSPFFKAGDYFYRIFGQIPKFFSDKNKLIKENEMLMDEIENYRLNMIDYDSVKYENQKLRDDLKIKPVENFIAASILARAPQIPLDSLLLNKGMEDGINQNDFVLASNKVLIGKIAKVSKNKSTVALNSFAGVVTYAYVARTSEPLEINGAGGGSIEAKVPIDFDIVVGDKIMAGGALSYLAAIIGAIEEDHSSGFKKILMSLPVDISRINTVFTEPFIVE